VVGYAVLFIDILGIYYSCRATDELYSFTSN
jgi:hypothetical protein